jgi:arylsulfatase B
MMGVMRYLASLALALSIACSSPSEPQPQPAKPNILILLADDLGWTDVSYHGGSIKTPNIDRLAEEGVKLDRFYVAPVCSPTRAGLMTGRYPIRFGAMKAVFPPWREGGMDTSEVTIANVLATAGYEHRGIFGKWHLGHGNLNYHPMRRGFTEFMGHYNGAIDYFTHEREGELDWHEGYESNYDEGYSTDLIAEAAVRFIKSHADDDSPFLCYVPFNAPHSPFQAKEEDLPLYANLAAAGGNWTGANTVNPPAGPDGKLADRRVLGAMVHALDQGIGSILDALDEAGIAENTFVIFSSDNGGVGGIGENAPLRGAKASVFEGGIRVAAAARWPGKIFPGRKVEVPMANIDVLPTVMRIAGIESSGGKPIDGVDVLDVLTGKQQSLDRELFNYIGQTGLDSEQVSYMTNEWKLLVIGRDVTDESADDSKRRKMLFHISEDMAEEHDVAAENPEMVAEMYEKIKGFRALQPADAILPYNEGRNSGFKAPKEWRIPGDYPR